MDISRVIERYLRNNRRLVVPTLGAFIVKESGEVLFSELLKNDDGVLHGLLAAEGMSELERAGAIDRFIFDIRDSLDKTRRCDIAGLGSFLLDLNGEIRFRWVPSAKGEEKRDAAPAEAATPAPMPNRPAQQPAPRPVAKPAEQRVAQQPAPRPAPKPAPRPAATVKKPAAMSNDARVIPIRKPVSVNPVAENKSVEDSVAEDVGAARVGGRHAVKPLRPMGQRRRRVDWVLAIAIAVLLVALSAIAYGWFVNSEADDDAAMEALRWQVEDTTTENN